MNQSINRRKTNEIDKPGKQRQRPPHKPTTNTCQGFLEAAGMGVEPSHMQPLAVQIHFLFRFVCSDVFCQVCSRSFVQIRFFSFVSSYSFLQICLFVFVCSYLFVQIRLFSFVASDSLHLFLQLCFFILISSDLFVHFCLLTCLFKFVCSDSLLQIRCFRFVYSRSILHICFFIFVCSDLFVRIYLFDLLLQIPFFSFHSSYMFSSSAFVQFLLFRFVSSYLFLHIRLFRFVCFQICRFFRCHTDSMELPSIAKPKWLMSFFVFVCLPTKRPIGHAYI